MTIPAALKQKVHRIRLDRGLTQAQVADEIGAKQSQISDFERGICTLGPDKLERLLTFFEIPLSVLNAEEPPLLGVSVKGFCSNPNCLSVMPYRLEGVVYIRPQFLLLERREKEKAHCRDCGDIIIYACPRCGADIETGLFCGGCGEAYLTPSEQLASRSEAELEARRTLQRLLIEFPEPKVYRLTPSKLRKENGLG